MERIKAVLKVLKLEEFEDKLCEVNLCALFSTYAANHPCLLASRSSVPGATFMGLSLTGRMHAAVSCGECLRETDFISKCFVNICLRTLLKLV